MRHLLYRVLKSAAILTCISRGQLLFDNEVQSAENGDDGGLLDGLAASGSLFRSLLPTLIHTFLGGGSGGTDSTFGRPLTQSSRLTPGHNLREDELRRELLLQQQQRTLRPQQQNRFFNDNEAFQRQHETYLANILTQEQQRGTVPALNPQHQSAIMDQFLQFLTDSQLQQDRRQPANSRAAPLYDENPYQNQRQSLLYDIDYNPDARGGTTWGSNSWNNLAASPQSSRIANQRSRDNFNTYDNIYPDQSSYMPTSVNGRYNAGGGLVDRLGSRITQAVPFFRGFEADGNINGEILYDDETLTGTTAAAQDHRPNGADSAESILRDEDNENGEYSAAGHPRRTSDASKTKNEEHTAPQESDNGAAARAMQERPIMSSKYAAAELERLLPRMQAIFGEPNQSAKSVGQNYNEYSAQNCGPLASNPFCPGALNPALIDAILSSAAMPEGIPQSYTPAGSMPLMTGMSVSGIYPGMGPPPPTGTIIPVGAPGMIPIPYDDYDTDGDYETHKRRAVDKSFGTKSNKKKDFFVSFGGSFDKAFDIIRNKSGDAARPAVFGNGALMKAIGDIQDRKLQKHVIKHQSRNVVRNDVTEPYMPPIQHANILVAQPPPVDEIVNVVTHHMLEPISVHPPVPAPSIACTSCHSACTLPSGGCDVANYGPARDITSQHLAAKAAAAAPRRLLAALSAT